MDTFVFLDDVNFNRRLWISRNRVLINGSDYRFSIPVSEGSQNSLIKDVRVHCLPEFRRKFLRQLEHAYKRSPYVEVGLEYVDRVLSAEVGTIAELACISVEQLSNTIGMGGKFLLSSKAFQASRGAPKEERLVQITRGAGSDCYVNAPGGRTLYDPEFFAQCGVKLKFIDPKFIPYAQPGVPSFDPALSVIDALMNVRLTELPILIASYSLD